MGKIILVTGGARSGKSRYSQALAETIPVKRCIVATCPIMDKEMEARILRHQEDRKGRGWETIEETISLAKAIDSRPDEETILIDCLTLWINNLLFSDHPLAIDDQKMESICCSLLDSCRARSGLVIMVTNEVGLGIVPENPLARRFRDLAGRCNQIIAQEADQVIFMVAGIPQIIKGE